MNVDLSGRTAVITGGSAGIGLACTKMFLEAGSNVAICGRDKEKLEIATKQLDKSYPGNRVISYCCNVLDKGQVGSFAAVVQDQFGGSDILINNAGQARLSKFSNTGDDDWREELDSILARYERTGVRRYFRANTAFLNPQVYKYPNSGTSSIPS